MQQVDHRPQMPAFLDVDLEKIAQVIQRRTGFAEIALLLDRCGFGIALRHDEASQHPSMLARNFAPNRFTLVLAESDATIGLRRGQKNSPSIVGHFEIAESRPSLRVD